MSTLEDWAAAVRADLGFDPEPLRTTETRAVLAGGSLRPPYGTGRRRA